MNVTDPGRSAAAPAPRRAGIAPRANASARGRCGVASRACFWVFAVGLLLLLHRHRRRLVVPRLDELRGLVRKQHRGRRSSRSSAARSPSAASTIVRTRPQRIILNDLRIANAHGRRRASTSPPCAQIEITGGVRVVLGPQRSRSIASTSAIRGSGSRSSRTARTTSRSGRPGPQRRCEIVHLDIGKLFITNGALRLPRPQARHRRGARRRSTRTVTVTRAEGSVRRDHEQPARARAAAGLRAVRRRSARRLPLHARHPRSCSSIALQGRGIEAFLSGKLDPLTEGVYDLAPHVARRAGAHPRDLPRREHARRNDRARHAPAAASRATSV